MPEPAAAPETPSSQPTGRARLGRALSTPSRNQLVAAVLLALLGFAAVTQIRANDDDTTYAGYRQQDLIDVISGLAATTQRTQAEIDRLTQVRDDLLEESTSRQAALEQAQDEIATLNVLAGAVPVTGPGIRVTITEETGRVQVSSMLDTIQELRSVGAEAIQVNGLVRVVAQTSFEETTGGLEVDGQLIESPYVVDAIGIPATLAGAMSFALGPRDSLERDGATVQVEEFTSLDVDTVREPLDPEVAGPR
ncbi:DUF881 domain-containing protein [Nocardioides marinquilinus]|uniref:DUF881 domain-containing protein n=1 Tax=Nocardioides marinquilinus TaxID=1210400 RepID=A0ABP9Q5M5_9ACTN